jgi:phosphoribosylformylglycinamidine cyclo-ligase
MIRTQSGTDWKEMYKVFNMGHRMEIYVPREIADDIIALSQGYGVEAKIIGYCEAAQGKSLRLETENGSFDY